MRIKLEKGRENKNYIIIMLVSALLLFVFLSSKSWLYDDSQIMQTPFNYEIRMSQSKVYLQKWEYNLSNQLMEVMIEIEHIGQDFIRPTFSFSARERGGMTEYPTNIVYHDDSHFVIQIEDVPESYKVIGLFIREHRDQDIVEAEIKERLLRSENTRQGQGNDETEFELPPPDETIIVGDYRRIEARNDLETRAIVEYQIDTIKLEIDQIEREIDLIVQERLPLQDRLIDSLESEISRINNDLVYQTEEEKRQSQVDIENRNNSIKNAMSDIESLEKQLELHEEKLEKLHERLNDVGTSTVNRSELSHEDN